MAPPRREEKWVTWYRQVRDGWVALRGAGAVGGITGAQLPAMTAGDAIALLAQLTTPLISAIGSISHEGKLWNVRAIDEQGLLYPTRLLNIPAGQIGAIEARDYVAYTYPAGGEKWNRTLSLEARSSVYGVDNVVPLGGQYGPARLNQYPLVSALREAIGPWSDLAQLATTLGFRVGSGVPPMITPTPDRKLDAAELNALWGAFYRATIALAVVEENPPQTTAELVAGAIGHAISETAPRVKEMAKATAEGAGAVAGFLAQTAGEAAGKAAKGFFSEAGIEAILVVAVGLAIMIS